MRTALNREGRLLGREVECWFDTGAYADNGPRVTATAGDAAPGPYRWAAYRVDAACVYTNTAPAGSYRAFGATHLQWIGELQVDELARRAGLDPLEVRRVNLCTPGEELRAGGKPLDADLVGDVERVAEAVGWGTDKPAGTGRGLSVGLLAAGAHPVSSAIVRMEADGNAVVLVGTTEVGQGAAHGLRPDRRRGAPASGRARHRARHRHALHSVRPLDRRQSFDHGGGARRQARRGAGSRSSWSRSQAPRTSSPTPTRSSSSATSGSPAAS